ncbi:hypothetical protein [Sporosarcina sp. P17b]|uniref:hypothetical protein n=1 Tax=Sporosarcina sp. P17b TaxID=2048260 RepID=UPI000C16BCA4|nr:hypothetical protein [Sporosarcina sp. P17b]PIC73326.1 hypothetical protein CSV76_10945 [Sporosarcina sp. P17b]
MFDTYTKQKSIEDLYEYNHKGVRKLLENYYRLQEEGTYSYDSMAAIIKMDIDRTLRSDLLEPIHLAIIGLRYALQLSFMEIQLYADIPLEEAMDAEEAAIQIIVEILDGKPNNYNAYQHVRPAEAFPDYILSVGEGIISPYIVTEALLTTMLEVTKHKDKLAKEVLRQRKQGPPSTFSMDKACESIEDEYPSHQTAASIESAGNKQAKKNEYDYFRNQDKKNLVCYEDFSNQAKSMRVSGRKKVVTNSELLGNKGMVYQI